MWCPPTRPARRFGQRARIDNAEIGDHDKRLILRENAEGILGVEKVLGAQNGNE